MSTLALSPRLPTASDRLKLTDGRCVRWFVEALQLFRRFDETSSKEALRDAKKILQRCVDIYPQDLLPRFYLAIAESVLGDMDQYQAIDIFERFSQSDQFEVRAAAEYNLAAAYIETYDLDLYPKAETILDQLVEDLQRRGAPIGIPNWLVRIYAIFSGRRVRVEQLYYQALEARTYLRVHVKIWHPRWQTEASTSLEMLAQETLTELEGRRKAIEKHGRFLGQQRPEIWAWHWNNVGAINEALAARALRLGDETGASALAAEAKEAYDFALRADPRFGSAKSNLGRLYLEVIRDLDKATKVLRETLEGVEDTDYTYYNLGLVQTLQGDRERAIEYFQHAPEMLRRRGQDATWTGARKMLIYELRRWGRAAEALQLLRELAKEDSHDENVLRQIRELEGETR
jgi:tetratricopeptide (TPR) repeat protein